MAADIVSKLFEVDLDEVLREIFFSLDSTSLRSSRCVCHQWNNFIKLRTLQSRPGRRRLEAKLNHQWLNRAQVKIEHLPTFTSRVVSLASDQSFIFCGLASGQIKVFCLLSGIEVSSLRVPGCSQGLDLMFLAVNASHILAILHLSGPFRIWRKENWNEVHSGEPHPEGRQVHSVCSMPGGFIFGWDNGQVSLIKDNTEWTYSIIRPFNDPVSSLHSHFNFLVAATSNCIKVKHVDTTAEVFSVAAGASSAILVSPNLSETEIALSSLFLLAVGDLAGWQGVKVWRLSDAHLVQQVDFSGRSFSQIASNGTQVSIMECDRDSETGDNFLFVLDLKELCTKGAAYDKRKTRLRIYEWGSNIALMAMNRTSLIMSDGPDVNFQDFWR